MNIDELLYQVRVMTDSLKNNYMEEITKTQKAFEGYVTKLKANERFLKSNSETVQRKGDSIKQAEPFKLCRILEMEYSNMFEQEGQTVWISDDLVTNESNYVSNSFKLEFPIKFDKVSKVYYTVIPVIIMKRILENTKIEQSNGHYLVTNSEDFFILQIISLESFYKFCIAMRSKCTTELDEQILQNNMLRNYIDNNTSGENSGGINQFQVFQNELQNIKETFKKKTVEFSQQEYKNGKFGSNSNKQLTELKEQNRKLVQEYNRLKEASLNVLSASKKQDFNFDKALSELKEIQSKANLEEMKSDSSRSPDRNFKVSPMKSREGYLESDNANFVDKVISEFDKILSDETKRIENYFNDKKSSAKNEYHLQRVSQIAKFTGKGEKNYVEWKPSNDDWKNALRDSTTPEKKKSKIKNDMFSNAAMETKDKIKNSITSSPDKIMKKSKITNAEFTESNKKKEIEETNFRAPLNFKPNNSATAKEKESNSGKK